MRLVVLLAAIAALAACGQAQPEATVTDKSSAPPFNTNFDVSELMVHVMDPAARQFWAGWGETYSREGLTDISAKTNEEWKKVADGATTVVVAANTLMLPAFQREPKDKWVRFAKKVADLAASGREGADKHDKAAMEDIGGRLNTACDECHKAFRTENTDPDLKKPTDPTAPAKPR